MYSYYFEHPWLLLFTDFCFYFNQSVFNNKIFFKKIPFINKNILKYYCLKKIIFFISFENQLMKILKKEY